MNETAEQIAAEIVYRHNGVTFNSAAEAEEHLVQAIAAALDRRAEADVEPEELNWIKKTVAECAANGAACGWRPCTGCHETNEGHSTGDYPFSKVFGCELGAGCSECGGLGVTWEYYDAAALKEMQKETGSFSAAPVAGEPNWQQMYLTDMKKIAELVGSPDMSALYDVLAARLRQPPAEPSEAQVRDAIKAYLDYIVVPGTSHFDEMFQQMRAALIAGGVTGRPGVDYERGRHAGITAAIGACCPHEDDDAMDKQVKHQCAEAISKLLEPSA